ncbi:unnamed protein product [Notodromas monacha]|uniref:Uncharacterized protein n=1 Tax=Notodromas monacha TaxID=399045 RepID=A0A7R9G8F5_9CRUS|nr:unnamed protein product [Notodromas monacha]CAG0913229.1 unnamed protein product [Notodromas monacha]
MFRSALLPACDKNGAMFRDHFHLFRRCSLDDMLAAHRGIRSSFEQLCADRVTRKWKLLTQYLGVFSHACLVFSGVLSRKRVAAALESSAMIDKYARLFFVVSNPLKF